MTRVLLSLLLVLGYLGLTERAVGQCRAGDTSLPGGVCSYKMVTACMSGDQTTASQIVLTDVKPAPGAGVGVTVASCSYHATYSTMGTCKVGDQTVGPNTCVYQPGTMSQRVAAGCNQGESTGGMPDVSGPYCYLASQIGQGVDPSKGRDCVHSAYPMTSTYGLCYRVPGTVMAQVPVPCLPGSTNYFAPRPGALVPGCAYDPSAGASVGCRPGDPTQNGMCYTLALTRQVMGSAGCQTGEQVLPNGSCVRPNGGGTYQPAQVPQTKSSCADGSMPQMDSNVCSYRPVAPAS